MFASLPHGASLGSDNHAGVHPEIMQAIAAANIGHMPAYGTDPISLATRDLMRRHFGDVDVHFVLNGTAANVLALRAMLPSYAAVLCANTSHLHNDECAAPEAFIGCKVQPLPSHGGKVLPADVQKSLIRGGDQHFAAPRVLSITQPTELGTVYSIAEMRVLADLVHSHHMYLHVDGARLVNAAVSLGVDLKALTADVGVDVLSFGGTKNGLLVGEAVVFFNRTLARDFAYMRKQSMQLGSKMRFISAQFYAFLVGDLWHRNAAHANAMAQALAAHMRDIAQVRITQPVQSNAVFACLPRAWIKPLRAHQFFYVWDEHSFEVRLMTSFDTQPADIAAFAAAMHTLAAA
jgi:threonine aldolase